MKQSYVEIFRFAVVGIISTFLTYLIYYLFLCCANPTISYFIGYLIGVLVNYFLTLFFTFKVKPSRFNGFGFIVCHVINMLLGEILLYIFICFGVTEQLAPIPTLAVCVPLNFIMVRFVMRKFKI